MSEGQFLLQDPLIEAGLADPEPGEHCGQYPVLPQRPAAPASLALSIRATLQMMLDALPVQAALVAPDGRILLANRSWQRFADRSGEPNLRIDGNYVAFKSEHAARGDGESFDLLQALAEVAAGSRARSEHSFKGSGAFENLEFRVQLTSIMFEGRRHILVNRCDVTELNRLRRQRRSLGSRLLRAQETERRRIARDLHDSTAQLLVGLQLGIGQLKRTKLDERCGRVLADCERTLESIQREIRTLSFICHPPSLDNMDLSEALDALFRGFGQRSELAIELDLDDVGELAPAMEAALYRVAQEALANIYRHADATRIHVRLEERRRCVHLFIEDDGVGLRAARRTRASSGVGISSMKERLAEIGGRLSLQSDDGGTRLVASVPRAEGAGHLRTECRNRRADSRIIASRKRASEVRVA
jgi:signal transduction histidine kinase